MRHLVWLFAAAGCTSQGAGGVERAADPVVVSEPAMTTCARLGLPEASWQESTGEARLDVAGDFTVPTTTGDWTFSENFTGCETILFVPSVPAQEAGWSDPLWEEDGEELRGLLPANTHVFFVSVEDDRADIDADLAMIEANLKTGMWRLEESEKEEVKSRLHYVTDGVDALQDTWVGRYLASPGYGFGIDRAQRIRDIGSLADGDRYSASAGWFEPNVAHVAHEAIQYNWEADRDAALASDGAVVVRSFSSALVEDSGWTGTRAFADLRLPDAAEMAAFDTLELDLTMDCNSAIELGTADDPGCPDWDRIVDAYLCDVADPDLCDVEVGRWISGYHRGGRWVSDASYLLPLLRDGGLRRLSMYSVDPYVITLDWRFSTRGAPMPDKTEVVWRAFPGMDDTYLANFPAREVFIPADAEQIELTVVVTGHGMSAGLNCAEFCDTTHTFAINGVEQTISFPQTADPEACQNDVDDGTIANQYGTWFYGRSNWCPGKVVRPITLDFTGAALPGGLAEVTYTAAGPDGPMPGGGATLDLSVFLTTRR